MLVIRGNIVHSIGPDELSVLPDHALMINSEGIIVFLGPITRCPEPEIPVEFIDLSPTQFVTPGFVDAHIHASQYPISGIFSDTLLEWLDMYAFPLESKFENKAIAEEVYNKVVSCTLRNGTTMASYFGTMHCPATLELAQACLSKGQRALVGRVCMERFCPEVLSKASIDSDVDHIKNMQNLDPEADLVKPVITPRFAPSCTAKTLKNLGKLAHDRNIPVQTHLSENANEIKLVGQLFPEAKNYTDVYAQAGLLKHDTILAHAIHLNQEEIDTIKFHHSGVVHCPYSNAAISSGIAPIKQYLKQGVKVGLGTDVGGGASMSILVNARLALLMSNLLTERNNGDFENYSLTLANALYMATLGGASVCGMDKHIGNFEEGKQFDAQIIDIAVPGSSIELFEFQLPKNACERLEHLVRKWVYVGDDRNTTQVWVGGRVVYKLG